MKRLTFILFLHAVVPLSAEVNGIEQSCEMLMVPDGDKFIRWLGHSGRSYFIQISDVNEPLVKWHWAPIIESGNDEEIRYEVDGTPNKGFFRLKYTDQTLGPNETLETADFDWDGISNWNEVSVYDTDPLNSDTDADGMPDGWEILYGLDPNDPADAAGDLVADGISNLVKYQTGRNPLVVALEDETGALALKVHTPME